MQAEDFAGTVFRIDLRKRPRASSSSSTCEAAEPLLTLPPPPSSVSLLLDVPASQAPETSRQEDRRPDVGAERDVREQDVAPPGAVLRIIPTNIKAERDVREQDVASAETAARRPQLSAPSLSRTLQWLRESSNALLCVLNLFVGIPLGSIIAMTLLASGFCCRRQGYPRAAKWLYSLCFVVNVLSITVSVIKFMNSD